jgi:hypothetical protein
VVHDLLEATLSFTTNLTASSLQDAESKAAALLAASSAPVALSQQVLPAFSIPTESLQLALVTSSSINSTQAAAGMNWQMRVSIYIQVGMLQPAC